MVNVPSSEHEGRPAHRGLHWVAPRRLARTGTVFHPRRVPPR